MKRSLPWLAAASIAVASAQVPRPLDDPFVGEWKLNLYRSRLAPDDRILNEVRTYGREGASITVEWSQILDGAKPHGEYTTRCDRVPVRLTNGSTLACWYTNRETVDGESRDPHDPKHIYYRSQVSPDGRTLTVTWFLDATRTKLWTKRVYDRAAK